MHTNETILILDFGSQYTQLIARKVRACEVYCEIHPYNIPLAQIQKMAPKGIILSGGPSSVYADDAPHPDFAIFELGIPILGICYGLQLIAYKLGGNVDRAARREFGRAEIIVDEGSALFSKIKTHSRAWMSHGDALTSPPDGFEVIAHSDNSPVCAVSNPEKKIYGVQFHPEVQHTEEGIAILNNFLRNICECSANWNAQSFIESSIATIKEAVGDGGVICALSGGVDSTVLAVLLQKAIGTQLHCIHIDSGLMREGESRLIYDLFKQSYNISIDIVDGTKLFLSRLSGVIEPEQKRKIIGKAFIDLFEEEALKFNDSKWLAQGTLYPDVIESVSVKGPSATIKSHHNVGGLPEEMNLKVLEPFRELFKDEVRAVGRELGVPEWFVGRHPFPGPGLGIRIIGEITPERLVVLRKADVIYLEEIRNAGLYDDIWQAFAVLLPVQSVGVMGDERTYENVCALRAVTSTDGMTADWFAFPPEVLAKISNRIINEVRGINRVVYDITSKPPGTIEWE
ncbi:MAG: guaA [Ignavibacteria bacterium]|nr:guaA [Ignavibacteria bacterium]